MQKLPLFLAIGDVATVLEKRRRNCAGEEMRMGRKKTRRTDGFFVVKFCSVNSKKMGKTTF